MGDPEAAKLFIDYNIYRAQTSALQKARAKNGVARRYKPTIKRLEFFSELIVWCRQRSLDPRLWLYHLFRSKMWMWPPPLEPLTKARGHFFSEKSIPKYEKLLRMNILDGYAGRLYEKPPPENAFDPNRDISIPVEQQKQNYVDTFQTERCMLEMHVTTFGFHPKSSVCERCPAKVECARHLVGFVSFDIMALRRGDISSFEAQAIAKQHMGQK